jgi:two-component system invasion response regulator UvrY
MKKTKLAIVDDHKLFREGLTELINEFNNYTVIIEADNGRDLIEQIKKENLPDIILLDINMKEMDGYETAEWLKENYPEIKIMAVSMYENENAIIRMLKLGARGYVLKDITKKELEKALISLDTKGYYYTELVTGKLVHALRQVDESGKNTAPNSPGIVSLSAREIEFLKWASTELTYKDIADKMNLSVHTIDGYRDALFEKLSVKSRVGLVLYAIKNKIVLLD